MNKNGSKTKRKMLNRQYAKSGAKIQFVTCSLMKQGKQAAPSKPRKPLNSKDSVP